MGPKPGGKRNIPDLSRLPSFLYNACRIYCQGKKRPDLDVDHPLSSAEIKERVELFPYILLVLAWLVTGQPLLLPSLCVNSSHCRAFSLASWTRGESILLSVQTRALPLLSLSYNRESLTLNFIKISPPPRHYPAWSRLLPHWPGEGRIPSLRQHGS
jgi:hypothetical protein